ncbi:MAG: class I SAM-dependent methyltransferase [Alphaproteobacteria bacterium]|nr:class I SAM-dependent methyltransferase [Alphaproteobacteria bacterium]
MGTLSYAQAKRFYDRFGSRQDRQAFYEDPAVDEMIAHSRFEAAAAVCEFGCGTGRLAARLLSDCLPADATYLALDISDEMVRLATARLAPWAGRARVVQTGGAPLIPQDDAGFDRLVSAYVLDLLSDDDIAALLAEAHRVLRPGGLLCLAGLTFGTTWWSRAVSALWQRVHAWRPQLLGGCRPVVLHTRLDRRSWQPVHHAVRNSYGISSEILVAARRDQPIGDA